MQRASLTDGTTPLVAADNNKKTISCGDKASDIGSTLAQITLGAVGFGAGAMYLGPAERCTAAASCGKWLAECTSKQISIAIFASGGGNFAAISAYFASRSINQFISFERKQPSWARRIVWGGVIGAFTISQSVSTLISTVSTSTKPWQTMITVAASTPNSLYSAVGTIDNELSAIHTFIIDTYRSLHYRLSDLFFEPSIEETRYRQQHQHYHQQRIHFLRLLDQHWQYLQTHPKETPIADDISPLLYLVSMPTEHQYSGCLRSTIKHANTSAALAMTGIISTPFILNNFHTIMPYTGNPITSGILTAYFSYSFIYSNLKLLYGFMQGVSSILDRLVTGKPVESLPYQLHPVGTAIALGIIFVMASLSYALMNVIFEMEFPEKNKVREGFRYTADIGIVLYHIAGMFYLFELVYATLAQNKQDKFLLKVQRTVKDLHDMKPEEFAQFIETNTDDYNSQLGIQRYRPTSASIVNCEEGGGLVQQSVPRHTGHNRFGLFCCASNEKAVTTPDEKARLVPRPT